jgi:YD repeat-containing protein
MRFSRLPDGFNKKVMKSAPFFLPLIFMLASLSGRAQYFYKDIVLTRQTQDTRKIYSDNKVKKVTILSTERNGEATPGFICTQRIAPDYHSIETFTKSADVTSSSLQAFYDAKGRLLKTVDTSDTYQSISAYTYNEKGELLSIVNTGLETDNQMNAIETHNWFYQDGHPVRMIKVKNGTDSTIVQFTADDKGNIIEERPVHGKENLPAVYYYYDNEGRLTDIVRYNEKAGRLLPDYVFEYDQQRISSMLFVPSGSNDYQKWNYEYDAHGLKARETCFNKQKEPIAQISYQYSFQ